jgi:enoyl-CoA hydratase
MEIMGMRAAIRAGTEIQALGFHQRSSRDYMKKLAGGLKKAFDERDKPFGDYRTNPDES